MTAAIAEAVSSGAIRVLDALVVEKSAEGTVRVVDVDDPDDALDLLGYPADVPGLLSEEDATDVAAELPDGTSAVIIAWENVWAVRLHQALADSGGIVALHERIEPPSITSAVEALVLVEER